MRDSGTTHHDHATDAADEGLAELLDLDGEVLRDYWTDALSWVGQAAPATGRVLDLGAGTGVGTIALAQRFAGAEVVAVDASADMLRRVRAKALDLGLADRVRTLEVDLDVARPALDPVDVTWASMSLHHLADPDRVLGDVFEATRPGGLIAVAEMTEPLRFLPHDVGLGRPGLEDRCLDALRAEHEHSLPHLGSAWAPRLEAAGFTTIGERTFTIELTAPHPPGTARYARLWLRRLSAGVAHHLGQDDLDTLATLLDGPGSLQHGADLHLHGSRTVTLARRP